MHVHICIYSHMYIYIIYDDMWYVGICTVMCKCMYSKNTYSKLQIQNTHQYNAVSWHRETHIQYCGVVIMLCEVSVNLYKSWKVMSFEWVTNPSTAHVLNLMIKVTLNLSTWRFSDTLWTSEAYHIPDRTMAYHGYGSRILTSPMLQWVANLAVSWVSSMDPLSFLVPGGTHR